MLDSPVSAIPWQDLGVVAPPLEHLRVDPQGALGVALALNIVGVVAACSVAIGGG